MGVNIPDQIKSTIELCALLSRQRDNNVAWIEQWAAAYIVNKFPEAKPQKNDLYALSRLLLSPIYLETQGDPDTYLLKLTQTVINYPLSLLQLFFRVVEPLLTVLLLNDFIDIYAKLPPVFKNTVKDFLCQDDSNRSLFDLIHRQQTLGPAKLNRFSLDIKIVPLEVLKQLKYYLKNVQRFSAMTQLQQAYTTLNKPRPNLTLFQVSDLSAPGSLDHFLENSLLRYPTMADRDFDHKVARDDFLIRDAKAQAEPRRHQALRSIFKRGKLSPWNNSIDREFLIKSLFEWIKLKYADESVELNDEKISAIYTLCNKVFSQELPRKGYVRVLSADTLAYPLDFLEFFSEEVGNFIKDLLPNKNEPAVLQMPKRIEQPKHTVPLAPVPLDSQPISDGQRFFRTEEQLEAVHILNLFVGTYAKLPTVLKNTVEDFLYQDPANRLLFNWIVRQETFDDVEVNHFELDIPTVSFKELKLACYFNNVQRFSAITELQQAYAALNKLHPNLTLFQASYLSAPGCLEHFLENSPLRYPTMANHDFDNMVAHDDFRIREAKAQAEPRRYQILQSILRGKLGPWNQSFDRELLIKSVFDWIKRKYADEHVKLNNLEIQAIVLLCKDVFSRELKKGYAKELSTHTVGYSLDFLEFFSEEVGNFTDWLYANENQMAILQTRRPKERTQPEHTVPLAPAPVPLNLQPTFLTATTFVKPPT